MLVTDETPAFESGISTLEAGRSVTQRVVFSKETVDAFIRLSADAARVHHDPAFAAEQGFEGTIVHGLLVGARFSRLLGLYLPGERSVIQSLQLKFRRPILVGREVTYAVRVKQVIASVGAVVLDLGVSDGEDILVSGKSQCVFPRPEE